MIKNQKKFPEDTPENDNFEKDNPVSAIPKQRNRPSPSTNIYRKQSISFTVFPDEKEMVNKMLESLKMNRSDFFMACIQNNRKKTNAKSFAAECSKVQKIRKMKEQEFKKNKIKKQDKTHKIKH